MGTLDNSSRNGRIRVLILLALTTLIFIYSLLLSISFGGIRADKRAKALNTAKQIRIAIENYRVEYGVYPVAPGTGKRDIYLSGTDTAAWGALIAALCGNIDPASGKSVDSSRVPNSRAIPFLSLRPADLDIISGVSFPLWPLPYRYGNSQGFNLAIDSNDDGHVGDKDGPAGKIPDPVTGRLGAVIEQGVYVWADLPPNSGPK